MNSPLITVVICTYNGEHYLAETLKSVLSQTYRNIEVVIVDDGSRDATVSIIERYAEHDSRIRFFVRENRGLPASRNFAFFHAKGEWIAIIDQDDLCYSDRLAKQLEVSRKFPTAGLIFCNTNYIDEVGKVIGDHLSSFTLPSSFIPKIIAANLLLIKGCYVDSEACFIKQTVVNCIGPLDESLSYACDYEYFIRAGLQCDFAYSQETLAAWRIHPTQESATNCNRFIEYRRVLMKYLFGEGVGSGTRVIIIFNLVRSHGGEIYRRIKAIYKRVMTIVS